MIRLSGKAYAVSGDEQMKWRDKIFEEQSYLANVYPGDTRSIGIIFCIDKAEIEYFHLGVNPLFRETYRLGDVKLKEKGYQHYEISNFCLPGMYSRHNSSYWTGKKYLGCGPSAHSYNGVSRQWNISSLDEYITNINEGKPYSEIEELDLYTRYNDFVITTIRTIWGMNLDMLKKTFGSKLYDYCLRMAYPHLQQGTLEQSEGVLKLTEKGIFISDGIMSDMLWV